MARIIVLVVTAALWASPAYAWDKKGHMIVATIAAAHLTPAAQKQVNALLASEGSKSMADVASWADIVKSTTGEDAETHSVDIPADKSSYEAAQNCKLNHCVVAEINQDVQILRDAGASQPAKLEALKYLIHFVGDIHQPLHATMDGNHRKVLVNGRATSLHKVWDSVVLDSQSGSVRELARRIDEVGTTVIPPTMSPADWAIEGRDIARDQILVGPFARRTKATIILPSTYGADNWSIARDRLKLAGLRLATLLNSIFTPAS